MKIQTNNFEETQKAGERFTQELKAGDIILLFGNLGSGKTTFVQGMAKGLGIKKRIISPTFIIVRRYELSRNAFYHIDLYRVESEDDIKGLGLPEILQEKNAIVAIEWPEKLGKFMPKNYWSLHFDNLGEDKRSITIEKYE